MSPNAHHDTEEYRQYFEYLRRITLAGRLYKRYVSSPILFLSARRFGPRVIEVGSGSGAGVLGAFPKRVTGLEINPFAVEYSRAKGLQASLIEDDGVFPLAEGAGDVCILDNVLEHINDPSQILRECSRVTKPAGGLVVAVPGVRGFRRDPDHKKFYGEAELRALDAGWRIERLFALPLILRSASLSQSVRQYCLVGVYRKADRSAESKRTNG